MSETIVKFPYALSDKAFKAETKPFFAGESRITSVSFPNKRLNLFKVCTVDYTLYISKVPKELMEAYKTFGKELAAVFGGMSKGDVQQVPTLYLTLNKNIGNFRFDYDNLSSFKMKSEGWYVEEIETEYIDFFSESQTRNLT